MLSNDECGEIGLELEQCENPGTDGVPKSRKLSTLPVNGPKPGIADVWKELPEGCTYLERRWVGTACHRAKKKNPGLGIDFRFAKACITFINRGIRPTPFWFGAVVRSEAVPYVLAELDDIDAEHEAKRQQKLFDEGLRVAADEGIRVTGAMLGKLRNADRWLEVREILDERKLFECLLDGDHAGELLALLASVTRSVLSGERDARQLLLMGDLRECNEFLDGILCRFKSLPNEVAGRMMACLHQGPPGPSHEQMRHLVVDALRVLHRHLAELAFREVEGDTSCLGNVACSEARRAGGGDIGSFLVGPHILRDSARERMLRYSMDQKMLLVLERLRLSPDENDIRDILI